MMRRLLPFAATVLLGLAAPVAAADDPVKTYKDEVLRILVRQKAYEAKELDRDLREAYAIYIKPWLDRGKPDAPTVIEYDFTGYRNVYEKWAAFETERGYLVKRLGEAGGEEAAKRLALELMEAVHDILKQEAVLAKSKPKSYSVHDQLPAILRWGSTVRLEALTEAIGKVRDEEAMAYLLGEAWERAAKLDSDRRTTAFRTAFLDAFARTGNPAAEAVLVAAATGADRRLRIVGLEGLARLPEAPDPLRERLTAAVAGDACYFVRVAAVEILGGTVKDPRAIPALARALETEMAGPNGALRGHLRRALTAIAGKDLGDAPESWIAFYDRNRAAIDGGTWKPGDDAGSAAAPDEKDSVAFYDIRTVSRRFLIFVDASDTLIKPVDIEVAKRKNFFEWNAMAPKDRHYVSQFELLKTETKKMVDKLPTGAQFNLVIMNGSGKLTPFWPQGLAPAEDVVKRKVAPFLEEVIVGGWAPQIEAIWAAYRMAGADPFGSDLPDAPAADTVFLLSDGVPSGGEIMYGPALVDDVRRKHRFLRMPIHTIRIDDYKDTAELVMKGIAEATGGTYVWRTKP